MVRSITNSRLSLQSGGVLRFAVMLVVLIGFGNTLLGGEVGNPFQLDDELVEKQFAAAQPVELEGELFAHLEPAELLSGNVDLLPYAGDEKGSVGAAFLLCTFLGGLGIHRLYLDAGGGVFVFYLLTGGGCGCLTTIDWILLLVELIDKGFNEQSRYYGCKKLFMFSCK